MDTNLSLDTRRWRPAVRTTAGRPGPGCAAHVPRSAQGEWAPPADRADPVEILIEQGKSRIQELLPIRYGRMRADPLPSCAVPPR